MINVQLIDDYLTDIKVSEKRGCKYVCSTVNKGEEQKKLNVLSNKVFVNALNNSGRACLLVSEELEDAIFVKPKQHKKYIVVFDHLDGSSNIESGVSIGAIFGIYAAKDKDKVTLDDVLQPRNKMLAAGYYMYGSSCMVKQNTNLMNCSFWICQGCGLEIKPVSHKLKNKILVFVAAGVKLYDLQELDQESEIPSSKELGSRSYGVA
ncbi:fructose-1,6-bisphosphatase, cytosolic-like [Arachis ipaensis]|uniref:fructose-1,6-bisphosphatase, cytosolic-like n=1 Tax=Arachis ipaensis TaxID=130454 RepID=UPI0007AFE151|nr:fructose-1,6-bisphosphatase, cytosolic-like [Arachis ipaensis]XP_025647467.1 fructose-1,6-bisphosphatase, cytosolic-like [Arachis hypogaea]